MILSPFQTTRNWSVWAISLWRWHMSIKIRKLCWFWGRSRSVLCCWQRQLLKVTSLKRFRNRRAWLFMWDFSNRLDGQKNKIAVRGIAYEKKPPDNSDHYQRCRSDNHCPFSIRGWWIFFYPPAYLTLTLYCFETFCNAILIGNYSLKSKVVIKVLTSSMPRPSKTIQVPVSSKIKICGIRRK